MHNINNNGKTWSKNELIITCYVYLNRSAYNNPKAYLARLIGRTEGSINMRFGNYEYYFSDGKYGLENGGPKVMEVCREFTTDRAKMYELAQELIKEYEN